MLFTQTIGSEVGSNFLEKTCLGFSIEAPSNTFYDIVLRILVFLDFRHSETQGLYKPRKPIDKAYCWKDVTIPQIPLRS